MHFAQPSSHRSSAEGMFRTVQVTAPSSLTVAFARRSHVEWIVPNPPPSTETTKSQVAPWAYRIAKSPSGCQVVSHRRATRPTRPFKFGQIVAVQSAPASHTRSREPVFALHVRAS